MPAQAISAAAAGTATAHTSVERQSTATPRFPAPRLDHDDGAGKRRDEAEGRGHVARLQRRHRQRAEADELALRNEDHPRDGEHEHQRECQQRVHRAIDDAVLPQQQGDLKVHADSGSARAAHQGWGWYFQAPFSIFTITRARWSRPR
jgi:hypothetical protein